MSVHLSELLSLERTQINAQADSKKAILEIISKKMANDVANCDFNDILASLINREKLGSTAIGHGVAIPHCRFTNLEQPIAAIIRLTKPIDFGAMDDNPVDLFFGLAVPEYAEKPHLEILAKVAEKFGNKDFRNQLRSANSNSELFTAVINN